MIVCKEKRATRMRLSVIGAAMIAVVASVGGVQAQGGAEMSDSSVKSLMNYAWAITPPKFTMPTGKEIIIDKSKRELAMVPLDVAREVVKVGRLSASAQLCGLVEEQSGNYKTLMAREQAKTKWSDQQLLFISQLHLFTVMMMTGGVKVVEKEGEKEIVMETPKLERPKADACSAAERDKVKAQLAAYGDGQVPAAKADAGTTKKQ
jgi:hypothetical protein